MPEVYCGGCYIARPDPEALVVAEGFVFFSTGAREAAPLEIAHTFKVKVMCWWAKAVRPTRLRCYIARPDPEALVFAGITALI